MSQPTLTGLVALWERGCGCFSRQISHPSSLPKSHPLERETSQGSRIFLISFYCDRKKKPLKTIETENRKIWFCKINRWREDGKPCGEVRKCLSSRRREGSACSSGGDGSRWAAFVLLGPLCTALEPPSSMLQQPLLYFPDLQSKAGWCKRQVSASPCIVILLLAHHDLSSFSAAPVKQLFYSQSLQRW